jgi:hypothetical protein
VPALVPVQGAEALLYVSIYEYSFQFFHSILHLCVEKLGCIAGRLKSNSRPARAAGYLKIERS